MLVDIVSKNGNLLLNIVQTPEGDIEQDMINTLNDIATWTSANGEGIYGTRPWKIYGEGPSTKTALEKNRFGGVKDVDAKPYTAADIRFTTKGKDLYAIFLGWPADGKMTIQSLAENSPLWNGDIENVALLGSPEKLKWTRTATGLQVTLPAEKPCDIAYALRITRAAQ